MSHPPADTRAMVERLLSAIARGDGEDLERLYADRVDFRVDWPADALGGEVPWIRPRSSAADMADHFREIAAHNRPAGEGTTVDRLLVDGADAVVLGTIRATLAGNGRSYEARFALHLTVEGGRVARHHVYEDSLAVWRAWTQA